MRFLPLACLLLAMTPLGSSRSRADFVDYSYHWSIIPEPVIVGTNPTGGNTDESSTGSVAFTLALGGSGSALLNGAPSSIPLGHVTTSSTANPQTPDLYSSSFLFILQLTDTLSGESDVVFIDGAINGTLTMDSSTLTAGFSDPLPNRLTLGSHDYYVSIGLSSIDLPAPGSPAQLLPNLAVRAELHPTSTAPLSQVPEPTGLLLATFAVPLAAFTCRPWSKGARSLRRPVDVDTRPGG